MDFTSDFTPTDLGIYCYRQGLLRDCEWLTRREINCLSRYYNNDQPPATQITREFANEASAVIGLLCELDGIKTERFWTDEERELWKKYTAHDSPPLDPETLKEAIHRANVWDAIRNQQEKQARTEARQQMHG